ncbi:hypothetical protein [Dickeya oryzae]
MKIIYDIIKNYEMLEARSAFYYLSRYLKQATHYDEYEKDLFIDDFYSAPSDKEKDLTLKLIKLIEAESGKKASDFTDSEYFYWMDIINDIESNLDPAPSQSVLESAEDALSKITYPNAKMKKQ